MHFSYRILDSVEIHKIIPLVYQLNEGRVPMETLKQRFSEIVTQNYECAVVEDANTLIGVTGLWYCTRHYAGKTVELDHVYLLEQYRSQGVGKSFMRWLQQHITNKGCTSMELNTYVQNFPSHKFYYNQGFEAKGYHFIKFLKTS